MQQLDLLIQILRPQVEIPKGMNEKWQLFQSLVNVREPVAITEDFLTVQDTLLQSIIAENGITDVDALEPLMKKPLK